jgi:natural product precursor
MKKLKLKALNFGADQVLSREQLKNVLGGDGSGGQCGSSRTGCLVGVFCYLSCNGNNTQGTCGQMSTYGNCNCAVAC